MGIGISLFGWSHENVIKNNWIALNGYGIYIGSDRPDNNTISENTIAHNYLYGVYISSSHGNKVFHNIFLDNWRQVQTIGSTNIWNDDYPSGGNYWSDYTGEDDDSDGIGDSAYVIDENNQDRYPLMAPWAPPAEHELVVVLQTPILTQLGDSAILNATIANRGLHSETDIVLSIIINCTVAESITIPLLQPNSLYTLSYRWTPSNEGTYNVTAYTAELLGEENIANNMFTFFVEVKTPILVPDDFATIQDAVNAANPEDMVFVKAGTYNEDILIDKLGLRLVGQDPATTIITKGIKVTTHKVSIINLTIQGGGYGIELESAQGCIVTGNTITKNSWGGIQLQYSSNNVFTLNNITNNYHEGMEFRESNYNLVSINNITNNYGPGIDLFKSSENAFFMNSITNNQGSGIRGSGSYNRIYRNEIANNSAYGIALQFTCIKNAVYRNNITNNQDGIYLSGVLSDWYKECPENNLIYENNIANNKETGIKLGGSLNNIFYHNNLINNTNQAILSNTRGNIWDNGYPSGGNYWSDYTGVDLYSGPYQNEAGCDGIGDMPYVVDENNTDTYPLMDLWPSGPGLHELEVTLEAPIRLTLGRSTLLNVTVSNKGGVKEENVTLFLFVNDTIVNYKTISLLEVDSSYTTSYLWTPVTAGRVNVTAYATPVLGEIYVTNNQKTKLVRVSSKPPVHNINTGLYYETIQEAIDANETLDGHTIKVEADIYYENIVINKSVSIIGEDPDATIIDAGERGTVVTVTANNVNISNFTLRNSGNSFLNAGVCLDNVQGSNISGNNIINNRHGVCLNSSSGNTISGNDITANSYGVYLFGSSYNNIFGNSITNNWDGIILYDSSNNNTISGNNITASTWSGIELHDSSNNTLRNNIMANNMYNLVVLGPDFVNDIDASNTVDGKPVYYWIDEVGRTVPVDAGYVALINCRRITVQNLNLTKNGQGILLVNTTNSTITKNNITVNLYGIRLYSSSNNSITGNNITNNWDGIYLSTSSFSNNISGNNITANQHGVSLSYSSRNIILRNNIINNERCIGFSSSSNNTITQNKITAKNKPGGMYGNEYGISLYSSSNNSITGNNITSDWYGISLFYHSSNNSICRNNVTANSRAIKLDAVSNNSIVGNNIANSYYGIDLERSSNNTIYHNNFLDNWAHVHIKYSGYPNVWDNGYPSGGNYWSDYTGNDTYSGPYQNETGSDGIGDTPYIIDENNTDRYPLMAPFNSFDVGVWDDVAYKVDIVSNSTISDFHFDVDMKSVIFNVNGTDGTIGFCRVTIPKSLLWADDGWTITVGDQTIQNYTELEDENFTYLYFTYNHSTQTVTIQGTWVIPEIPSTMILTLFTLTTLIATILLKRKRKPKPQPPS